MKGSSVLTINGDSWSIKFAVCETGATTTRLLDFLLALTFGQLGFLVVDTLEDPFDFASRAAATFQAKR